MEENVLSGEIREASFAGDGIESTEIPERGARWDDSDEASVWTSLRGRKCHECLCMCVCVSVCVCVCRFLGFFFFCFFRTAPVAYGGSQARGLI